MSCLGPISGLKKKDEGTGPASLSLGALGPPSAASPAGHCLIPASCMSLESPPKRSLVTSSSSGKTPNPAWKFGKALRKAWLEEAWTDKSPFSPLTDPHLSDVPLLSESHHLPPPTGSSHHLCVSPRPSRSCLGRPASTHLSCVALPAVSPSQRRPSTATSCHPQANPGHVSPDRGPCTLPATGAPATPGPRCCAPARLAPIPLASPSMSPASRLAVAQGTL